MLLNSNAFQTKPGHGGQGGDKILCVGKKIKPAFDCHYAQIVKYGREPCDPSLTSCYVYHSKFST